MYRYECATCDDEGTFADLAGAQEAFTEHARERHEVVLRRVESPVVVQGSTPDDGSPPVESADAGTEENDPVVE